MNLYIRLFVVMIAACLRARIGDILATASLRFRVLPTDLDLNGHMNNGRYLTLMDLGRLDLITRNGMLRLVLKEKLMPVLSAAKIRYRLPLMPLQPFTLETRVVCWDDKWVYMEQRFVIAKGDKKGVVAAIAVVKGGFLDRKVKEMAVPASVLARLGATQDSPPMPAHITEWQKAEDALKTITAA